MPIVAIAGAALAWAVAAPTVGALIGGATLASVGGLTAVLEITAAVGATLGAIGSVTKDKGLMTAGMVIGGISAVGSIANAAGLFGNTADLFGTASTAEIPSSIDITGPVARVGGPALTETSEIPSAITISGPVVGSSTPIMDSVINSALGTSAVAPITPVDVTPLEPIGKQISAAEGTDVVTDPSEALIKGVTFKPPAEPTPEALANVPKTDINFDDFDPTAGFNKNAGVKTLESGIKVAGEETPAEATAPKNGIQGVLDFVNKNPMASYGMLQAAGSLMNGMFSPLTPAQVDYLNSQSAENRANIQIKNQIAANMAGGIPVASLRPKTIAPVTGAPLSGAINTPAPTVTGAPV